MAVTENTLVELRNIHYRYRDTAPEILRGADFTFGERRIGLIGPNGCGKTTLLHIAMGLLQPHQGEVRLDGVELQKEKDFFELRRRVGFVFQHADDQLFCPTVLEDVAFGPLNLGLSAEAASRRALQTLERLGLSGYQERLTHRLSGGEKKLVSLATVLAMEPRVLVLDEPTSTLDPTTRERLIQVLGELNLPSVIVSHDWDFLARVVEEYWTIEQGLVHRCHDAVAHPHVHLHPAGDLDHSHLG